jgi:hypothetical protein
MSPTDIGYYRHRAEAERAAAKTSSRPEIAEIHLELAGLYDKLVELEKAPQPTLRLVDIMYST